MRREPQPEKPKPQRKYPLRLPQASQRAKRGTVCADCGGENDVRLIQIRAGALGAYKKPEERCVECRKKSRRFRFVREGE